MNIVGTRARMNGQLTRILGVMPQGYAFPTNKGIWLPLSADELEPAGYSGTMLGAYARLRPGVAVEAVEAELTAVVRRVRLAEPNADERALDAVSVTSFQEAQWGALGTVPAFSVSRADPSSPRVP